MSDDENVSGPPVVLVDPRLEGCTCLWTANSERASIYVGGDDCPLWPHPRSYEYAPSDG